MKISKWATFSFLGLSVLQTACASERVFDVQAKHYVTREVMLEQLSKVDDVVVGEKHDTASIQNAEARLFTDFVKGRRSRVTFAWEFWNWSEREILETAFSKFRTNEIPGQTFLDAVFGAKDSEPTYLPLMEAVKASGADVMATNLTRAEKAPVVKSGLGALDPALLPLGFALGGPGYFERFALEMAGHATSADLQNYFAAQSLVDDIVADHFIHHRMTPSAFLVIGNFHTRYFDGVWKRIETRSPSRSRTLVEIADPEDETDWDAVMHSPKYGNSADFVIFTR